MKCLIIAAGQGTLLKAKGEVKPLVPLLGVSLIDLSRFIALWQEFYEKLTDEDKSLLPLTPIYFLAKTE